MHHVPHCWVSMSYPRQGQAPLRLSPLSDRTSWFLSLGHLYDTLVVSRCPYSKCPSLSRSDYPPSCTRSSPSHGAAPGLSFWQRCPELSLCWPQQFYCCAHQTLSTPTPRLYVLHSSSWHLAPHQGRNRANGGPPRGVRRSH